MVIWLPVARPGVPNTRSLCSVKGAEATINLDSADGATVDARGDIIGMDIMLD